jgi:prevent-host-death family protein
VVTCDYIQLMKPKRSRVRHLESPVAPAVLRDAVTMPGIGLTFPVRVAKAKLSALLDLVTAGQEVVITSAGRPKARLVSTEGRELRRPFRGTLEALKRMPLQTAAPWAEDIIRADRDGRGW